MLHQRHADAADHASDALAALQISLRSFMAASPFRFDLSALQM
jgi:hypothetical protein